MTGSIKRTVVNLSFPDRRGSNNGSRSSEWYFDSANKAIRKGKLGFLRVTPYLRYHLVLNNRGEVVEIVIPKDMLETAIKAAGLSDINAYDLERRFRMRDKSFLKSVFQSIMRGTCPEQAVGVGDTWEEKYSISREDEQASFVISGTYKLMKVDEDFLHVKYQGSSVCRFRRQMNMSPSIPVPRM